MSEKGKKPKSKQIKSTTVIKTKPKESKSEYFLRIAKPRVENVLKALRILGNCSNRNNYEYTKEQVKTMFDSIQESLNTTESKFSKSKKEQESFDFV